MTELTKLQEEILQEIALIEDDEINYTDMPQSTAAQLARALRGPYPEARKILDARREAGRPATAFSAPIMSITQIHAFSRAP
jgi:hypothetical protein